MKTIKGIFIGLLVAVVGLVIGLISPENPIMKWVAVVTMTIGILMTIFFMLTFKNPNQVFDLGDLKIPIKQAIKMAKWVKSEHSHDEWQKIYLRDDFWEYINSISKRKAIRLAKRSQNQRIQRVVLNREDVNDKDIRRYDSFFNKSLFPFDGIR